MSLVGGESASAPPTITCDVTVPASVIVGQQVPITVALHNRSATKVAVLEWGTPFEEAWLQPFVTVQRDGAPVVYGGALVKRSEPAFDEYFGLAPQERREAVIDLALAFDLSKPGRYNITPRIVLYDVAPLPAALPRPRAVHQPQPVKCRAVSVVVTRR